MGQNGPITLTGEDFTVQTDGTIIQNGVIIDKLLIKNFTDTSTLRKFGSDLSTKNSRYKGTALYRRSCTRIYRAIKC